MSDVKGRAREALNGNGAEGMYDDYDQAIQWSGLVADLLSLVEEQEWQLQAIDNLDVSYPCGLLMGGTVDCDDLRAILDGELQ